MPEQEEIRTDAMRLFLIKFTEELIRNSYKETISERKTEKYPPIFIKREIRKEPVLEIEQKTEVPEKEAEQNIPEKKEEKEKKTEGMPEFTLSKPVETPAPISFQRKILPPPQIILPAAKNLPPPVLRIPEPRLPETFSYLKPLPTHIDLDLGKLNILIRDPSVGVIECNGSDQPVMVEGRMGRKPTEITLTNAEMADVIKKFSEKAKIPINIGIYRVVLGKFIFSAIISDVVESKFIIKKIG